VRGGGAVEAEAVADAVGATCAITGIGLNTLVGTGTAGEGADAISEASARPAGLPPKICRFAKRTRSRG
jgi:hypothetical protein